MGYQELLSDSNWQKKRMEILKRDSFRCQNCNNQVYQQEFESGLVMGNHVKHGASPNVIINGKYFIHIWDIKNDTIQHSLLGLDEASGFKLDRNYIAYYIKKNNNANIFGLRVIEDSKIEINHNVLDIINIGIRGKFSSKTRTVISSPIAETDNWDLVKGLHVHHTYYQKGLLPWEYPDDSLITLCWTCHEKLHQNSTISVYDENGNNLATMHYCLRCHGAGYFPEYKHVQKGICFRCGGARYEELI